MQVVAHRGAPDEALENSPDAFAKAIEAGAQRIELDVQLSRDLVPIVLHDSLLGRTTTLRGELRKTLFASLQRGRLKNGQPIPTLDQTYRQLLNEIELNVELKSGEYQLVDQVLKLSPAKSQRSHQIIFSSFHISILAYMRRRAPSETIALLVEKYDKFEELQATMTQLACTIIHPDYCLIDSSFMTLAKKNNWQVVPYISIKKEIDCEKIWTHLVELQVDGFCTNYPRAFKLWLDDKGIPTK